MKGPVGTTGIIARGDTVLVLRRSFSDGFLPGARDLPGGGLGPDESPEEGVIREVREEAGLRTAIVRFLGSRSYLQNQDTGKRDKVMMVYQLRVADDTEVRLSDEHDAYRWVSVSELKELFAPGDLMLSVIRRYFESNSTG